MGNIANNNLTWENEWQEYGASGNIFFAYQECGLRVNLFNILPIPVLVALGDLKELKFPSYRTQGHAQK